MSISQVAILIFSSASIWAMAGIKHRRLGFIFGLCGQPFWLYTTYVSGQWGMFVVSCWFTVNHIRGLVNNWR